MHSPPRRADDNGLHDDRPRSATVDALGLAAGDWSERSGMLCAAIRSPGSGTSLPNMNRRDGQPSERPGCLEPAEQGHSIDGRDPFDELALLQGPNGSRLVRGLGPVRA